MPPGFARNIGLALFAFASTAPTALNASVGTFVTERWGWQGLYYFDITWGLTFLVLAWRFLRPAPRAMRLSEIDWLGYVILAVGLAAAVDALQSDDVMVVSRCDGSFWGELLSTAARYRGCRGVVIDGQTRDSAAIIDLAFPVFCRGISCADSLGRLDVVGHDLVIECGGVMVEPGDVILADYDGIVVIPQATTEEVLAAAEEKVSRENLVRQKLAEGMSVTEAFRCYGIL